MIGFFSGLKGYVINKLLENRCLLYAVFLWNTFGIRDGELNNLSK